MKIIAAGIFVILCCHPAGGQQSAVPTQAIGVHDDKKGVSASTGDDPNLRIKKGSESDVSAIGRRKMGGRGLHNWYSAQWERDTGLQYSMQIERSMRLVTDPAVVAYVDRIGQRLVRNSDAKGPFTIKVLNSDEVNAMALPGGHLYVTKGLILECQTEDELAGAIAHEIAHVAAHHAAREMTQMEYVQLSAVPMVLLAQGSLAGYGLYEATQLALPMPLLEFSRRYEAEADYLGAQYLYKAGYDPQGMVKVLGRLATLQKQRPGAVARSFAGHPGTAERELAVDREIETILPPKEVRFGDATTQAEFTAIQARLKQASAAPRAAADGVAQKN